MINEAARCLEEKVVADPKNLDLAMIFGTGFPPFRGGPLAYADKLTLPKVEEGLKKLENISSSRFKPCSLISKLAQGHKTFYP